MSRLFSWIAIPYFFFWQEKGGEELHANIKNVNTSTELNIRSAENTNTAVSVSGSLAFTISFIYIQMDLFFFVLLRRELDKMQSFLMITCSHRESLVFSLHPLLTALVFIFELRFSFVFIAKSDKVGCVFEEEKEVLLSF